MKVKSCLLYTSKAEYVNPFNPEDISITAHFISPSGIPWKINGFYNYNSWQSLWNLRFSPNESGKWTYQVLIKDKNGVNDSIRNSFIVTPSMHKGPIHIAPNKRFLQYANGTSFYGVGMWYNDNYAAYNLSLIHI